MGSFEDFVLSKAIITEEFNSSFLQNFRRQCLVWSRSIVQFQYDFHTLIV